MSAAPMTFTVNGVKHEVIVYTLCKDGEPYQEWTENGRTVRVGETVTVGWGSLAGQTGKILRFCQYRTDRHHVDVELPDGTTKLWPMSAVLYATKEEFESSPPSGHNWQIHIPSANDVQLDFTHEPSDAMWRGLFDK